MAASEMCIPYPPPLQTSVGFISVVFLVNFAKHQPGKLEMIQDYEQHIDKRETILDKKSQSLILRGPQFDVNISSLSSPYPT